MTRITHMPYMRSDERDEARVSSIRIHTDWLDGRFWAEPVATVREAGAALLLPRGNARYRFVRE